MFQLHLNLRSTYYAFHAMLFTLAVTLAVHQLSVFFQCASDGWYCIWHSTVQYRHWVKAAKCHIALRSAHVIQSPLGEIKVSKGAKIRSRYNQVPHLTQDTNAKVSNSQLDTTNESQEVSPFPADDHKAHTCINRGVQRHSKHKTENTIKDPQKKYRLGTVSKIFYWMA